MKYSCNESFWDAKGNENIISVHFVIARLDRAIQKRGTGFPLIAIGDSPRRKYCGNDGKEGIFV